MPQARLAEHVFTAFKPTGQSPLHFIASACRNRLLAVLERLHIYSAPIIISAEFVRTKDGGIPEQHAIRRDFI